MVASFSVQDAINRASDESGGGVEDMGVDALEDVDLVPNEDHGFVS